MAKRPIFIAKESFPFFEEKEVEFTYYSGFAVSQKQKSIKSLHENYMLECPGKNILEVSSKSTEELGFLLSAFNLKMSVRDCEISVECVFQGSKVFENGGPYTDIYSLTPWEAKKDSRLKESGNIVSFSLDGEDFSNDPKDFFYNWIYIKALCNHPDYLEKIAEYDAFTDIEFNAQKSLNCQARSAAIAVGLIRAGLLEKCMSDKTVFLNTVYEGYEQGTWEQTSLF